MPENYKFNIEDPSNKIKNSDSSLDNTDSYKLSNELVELMLSVSNDTNDAYEQFKLNYSAIEDKILSNDIRLLYSIITSKMYNLEDMQRNIVETNLQYLNQLIKERFHQESSITLADVEILSENKRRSKLITKIYDHFALSFAQIQRIISENVGSSSSFTALQDSAVAVAKKLKDFQGNLDKYLENSNELENRIDKINFDIVSVLGVFTGITFVLFGGLGLISDIKLGSNFNLFFKSLIIGIILIDVTTILLQYIRSIIDSKNSRLLYLFINPLSYKVSYFIVFNIFSWSIVLIILIVENRHEALIVLKDLLKFIEFPIMFFNLYGKQYYINLGLIFFITLIFICISYLVKYIQNRYYYWKYIRQQE